jgi:glucose/arabinose dehydrogenase
MGHRNPQGLAFWHPASGSPFSVSGSGSAGGKQGTGDWKLFASEHGPVGNDELNLISPGKNYLWPDKQCTDEEDPAVLCFPDTIAPSGMSFHGNRLYLSGLRGTQVREITFDGNASKVLSEQIFLVGYGRIRDVIVREDNMYVLTSNRDGRGIASASLPALNDDRILMIDLEPYPS